MKLNTFLKRAPGYYSAGRSVYLRGPIGRGKTETMEALPAVLSQRLGGRFGFVVVSGPLLNPPDAVGYLMPEKGKDDVLRSVFTQPFFYQTEAGDYLSDYSGGIILVDEADKMDPDVKKIIGEAALSGRLGPHRLPNGWLVWFAGNRQEDRSGTTKEYDHLITRRLQIDLDDDLQSFEDWAFTNNVHPAFITFANQNPNILFEPLPEKQGPWCNPRALVNLARYMEGIAEDGKLPLDSDTLEEAQGMIGKGAAMQLFALLRLGNEMPKFSEIIANPNKAKVPSKPDAQMLVTYSLAARVKESDLEAVITYMERLPAEFTVTFARAACHRDANLVDTAAFGKWCAKNVSLMMAITQK